MQFVATPLSLDTYGAGLFVEGVVVSVDPVATVRQRVFESVVGLELVGIDIALWAFADDVFVREVGGHVVLQPRQSLF